MCRNISSLYVYSVLLIGLCEAPLFVVLQVNLKKAPSSCTNSTAFILKTNWWCMELGRGLEEEEEDEEGWVVVNLQDAACARAPEPLISTGAY